VNTEMTDEELIRYCEERCQAERFLFKGTVVNRMLALSGSEARVVSDGLFPLFESMRDMCAKARERLNEVRG
jgi:hypothetical protein